MKSDIGTSTPSRTPYAVGTPSGFSPSGKMNGEPPGSNDIIAFTLSDFNAVRNPGYPPREWLTRIAGPVFSNTAAIASLVTSSSYSPVSGVACLCNCSIVAESAGNCEPENTSPLSPIRNSENSLCAEYSGPTVTVESDALALPRRGWSITYTPYPLRRNMFWKPSRPSGVVSHVFPVCPPPCSITKGSGWALTGI